MTNAPTDQNGLASKAIKKFWSTRTFWAMIIPLIFSCISIGYIIGDWYAGAAYRQQSESRKLILAQCIKTNDKLTSQLAALGDKTADALDKLTTER